MTSADFSIVLPEFLLAVYAMVALLAGVWFGKDKLAPTLLWITSGVMLVIAAWIGLAEVGSHEAFGGLFIDDAFSRFTKVMILIAAALVLAMGTDYMQRRGLLRFEYPILATLAVIGMMMMVSAGNLMSLYMGLELQSLALYIVAALRRESEKSSEAGLKYFVLGALSSGILLYGASLTYGFAGTTQFAGIIGVVQAGHLPIGLLFGMVFLIAGLAFKVSAVPFHMWTPDVYEGSPTPVTAFFATAPKIAAMALIARLVFDAFGQVPAEWGQILALLAGLSMVWGSVAAIGQSNIKRLMAYSSITHMGYVLLGLSAGTVEGVQSMLTYMAIYVTMNVGVFAFMLSMERDGQPVTELKALNQYARQAPVKALAMLVLLFSLAGVPPMLGFFAKFAVLEAALHAGYIWLVLLGVIASVVAAFYYLRIVFYMYFGKETDPLDNRMPAIQWGLLVVSALAMLIGIFNLFGIEGAAQAAAAALVN
ncbi:MULTISPECIES: NADH-quinone oxidoreductase subunit NuoN [Thioclava]|uniref:NADH-quinone oxidoreductase subunit N n=1 Tax=Thioclava nitratireducens TaxID=1915078 RepID=A0ABM6IGH0_9RHOB|nr:MULTISPECIES: NADH-quinone oxidoreductase subunit NuoN [Thioclava]AQS47810.1 NADH-quinone oxidoreductase subunit N [Thioclava nitratireducens]OWY05452.1 NADH-quinone oxidoreductase subunit N [Thioclava sp. F1Mire-8]OWY07133.1 NADH-quinone oxidoreductase subunit N [Thioclava sp. IC9]OWY10740.1 NADH-quinone oxidoreductase subunit N [Thioclava sp. F42-5]OWY12722.1 NADH-quinone oxidoreductase subunit N [Thioclava sp. F34-6]